MSDQRVHDTWDDDRLDQMLQDALAVDPSPLLRARVRARITAEPLPSFRLGVLSIWVGAATAITAVVLGGTVASRVWNQPVEPAPQRLAAVTKVPAPESAPPTPSRVAPIVRTPPTTGRVTRARGHLPMGPAHSAQGEAAQFAPADRAAFAWFLALSRTGQLPLPETLPPVSYEGDVMLPAIEISTIDIPPLVISSVAEGESQ